MTIHRRSLTLEEFLALPEKKPALEFADGVVTQKVSPKTRHSRLQGVLYDRINRICEPAKTGCVFIELRVTFAGASRVPDLSVFRWDRIARDSTGRLVDDVFVPPDIAIEILSPGQRRSALVSRCHWYIDHGVQLALLVDPEALTVLRFRPGSEPVSLQGAEPIDLGEIIPGVRFTADELFGELWLAQS